MVLAQELPPSGMVQEVASGSGEHAVYFARTFPHLQWRPSDTEADALASISDWAAEARLANLRDPIQLDAGAEEWPVDKADALVCINMVHISPWSATEGLLAGAARLLPKGAPLILYGPYRERGVPTADSNEIFDANLRARDPQWGLRLVEDIDLLARTHDFVRTARYAMPANNLMLVYRLRLPER